LERRYKRAFLLQFGVLAGSVLTVLLTSFALAEVLNNRERTVIAFAKPALEYQGRWVDVSADFASRLQGAFGLGEKTAREYADWILEAAAQQDLDPYLLAGLVHAESTFRKYVRSSTGALGPTQVKPKYWSAFCGHPNLLDPEQNIQCGARVLAHLRDLCGDVTCALKAYNVGAGSMRGAAAQRYLRKIDRRRALLAEQTVL
jgi:soluble lytic murein transglycosylase-like protein